MRPVLTQSQTTVFMTGLVLFILGFQTTLGQGQTNRNFENALQNTQDLQSRIRSETVQRQSEFLRVETTNSQLAKRASKLEGRLLLTRTYPTITIREANAALDLARATKSRNSQSTGQAKRCPNRGGAIGHFSCRKPACDCLGTPKRKAAFIRTQCA